MNKRAHSHVPSLYVTINVNVHSVSNISTPSVFGKPESRRASDKHNFNIL